MAIFTRPTFTEILQRIQSAINTRLPGSDGRLRRSLLNVVAYVLAGVSNGLYVFLAWIADQIFVDTAEEEQLRRWGSIWGVSPTNATPASGLVICTGTNGVIIPEGTELQRTDGILFETLEDVTIALGTATVEIISQENGSNTNTSPSSVLTFVSPIDFIDSIATVENDGLTGGTDDEEDEQYRQRLLDRIQNPPQGGCEHDYIQWALQVSGVTRAWIAPRLAGIGTVTVFFMMDNLYEDGIPEASDVTNVSNYIETKRPAPCEVFTVAPIAYPINFTIELNQDSAAIRLAVEASLREMITRDSDPKGGAIYLSRINEAISLATGEFDHTTTVPSTNVTPGVGNIATMGTITWV